MARGSGELDQLDTALIRLRRLWVSGAQRAAFRRAVRVPVDMSVVLVADAVARGPEGEVTVGTAAERLDVEPSTASRLVDRAVAAGCVSREADAGDSRRTTLSLTPEGRELAAAAEAFRHAYLERLLGSWPAEDRAAFARLLARFADEVASTPVEGPS